MGKMCVCTNEFKKEASKVHTNNGFQLVISAHIFHIMVCLHLNLAWLPLVPLWKAQRAVVRRMDTLVTIR